MGFAKLAFKRGLWPEVSDYLPSPDLYYHTGVTLPRQDGQVDIVEVKMCGNVVQLSKKEAAQLMEEQKKTRMFIDNRCLQYQGALDTKRTLFRLSRIMGKSINYNPTRLNCNHVAMWLLTGRIEWTTAVVQVNERIPLPDFGSFKKLLLVAKNFSPNHKHEKNVLKNKQENTIR